MSRYVWESKEGYEDRLKRKELQELKETNKHLKKANELQQQEINSAYTGSYSGGGIAQSSNSSDSLGNIIGFLFLLPVKILVFGYRTILYCYHSMLEVLHNRLGKTLFYLIVWPILFQALAGIPILIYILFQPDYFVLSNSYMFIPYLINLSCMAALIAKKMWPLNHVNFPKYLKTVTSFIPIILISIIPAQWLTNLIMLLLKMIAIIFGIPVE